MKHVYRFSLPGWAVPQQEEFYALMARRGLFVEKRGFLLTRFSKGDPAELLYRLDAAPSRGQPPEEERLQFYERCGWHFVCKADYFHLYCAEKGAGELHTDAAWQNETLLPVRKSLRDELIGAGVQVVFWLLLFFLNFWVNGGIRGDLTVSETTVLFLAQCGFVLPALLILLILLKLFTSALAMHGFTNYLRSVRGEKITRLSLRGFLFCEYGTAMFYAAVFLALICTLILLTPRTVPMGQEPSSQVLLRLEQLEPNATVLQGTGSIGQESGQTEVVDVPLASLQLHNLQLSDTNGNTPWLDQHYIQLSGPLDPVLVAQSMAKYLSLGDPLPVKEPLPAGIDCAFLDDSRTDLIELCLASENRILHIQYLGSTSDAQTVMALASQALTENSKSGV